MATFAKTSLALSMLSFLVLTTPAGWIGALSHSVSFNSQQMPVQFQGQSSQNNLSLIYPNPNMATFQNASSLCGIIAEDLGIPQLLPNPGNFHTLPGSGDETNWSNPAWSTEYSYACYHWWGYSAGGKERPGNPGTIGALFNEQDQLVEVRIYPLGTLVSNSTSAEDLVFAAKTLAHSIGIPDLAISNETVEWQGNFTDTTTGLVTVYHDVLLSSTLGGLQVDGANRLYVHFENSMIWKVTLWCFYDSPPIQTVGQSVAVSAALNLLLERLNESGNMSFVSGPYVRGLVLDQDSMTIAYTLGAVFRPDSSHPRLVGSAEVLVNAETGIVLSYYYSVSDTSPTEARPDQDGINRLFGESMFSVVAVGLGLSFVVVGLVIILAWPLESPRLFDVRIESRPRQSSRTRPRR